MDKSSRSLENFYRDTDMKLKSDKVRNELPTQ